MIQESAVSAFTRFTVSDRVASCSLNRTIRFWDLSRGVCDHLELLQVT